MEVVLDDYYEKKAKIDSILFDTVNAGTDEDCSMDLATNQMKFTQETPISAINSLLVDVQGQEQLSEELSAIGDCRTEEEWEEELRMLRKDEAAREFVEVPRKPTRKKRSRREDIL